MDKFTTVSGPAAPMLGANIDTDVIIPIQRLVGTGRTGLGPYAFERLRYNKDGSDNPDFVLNRHQYRDSPILLAGPNFGCGSSREGAVWALMGMGFRAVLAPSFGDIFFNNCFQNGLLPVVLPEDAIRRIAEETEGPRPRRARATPWWTSRARWWSRRRARKSPSPWMPASARRCSKASTTSR